MTNKKGEGLRKKEKDKEKGRRIKKKGEGKDETRNVCKVYGSRNNVRTGL